MIVALLSAGVFFLAFQLIGFPISWLLLNGARSEVWLLPQVLGLAVSVWVSAMVVGTNGPAWVVLAVTSMIAVFFWLIIIVRGYRPNTVKQFKNRITFALIVLIPSGYYARLLMSGIGFGGFTMRNGPDLIGWSGAVLSICRGDTLKSLASRVQEQLGSTALGDAFIPPTAGESKMFISQIPSFTDQIASEFLIGAHRTGIPGLLGAVCNVADLPAARIGMLIGGLSVWAIAMLAMATVFVLRALGVPNSYALLFGVAVPINFSILSTSLEGGFAQLIALPLLLISVAVFSSRTQSMRTKFLTGAGVLAFATTSYIDLLYIWVPISLVAIVVGSGRPEFPLRKATRREILLGLALMFLAFIPSAPFIASFTAGFLNYSGISGWNQGHSPLPANLFGLATWLPDDGKSLDGRELVEWCVDISFSAVIFVAIAMAPWRKRLVPFTVLGIYAVIFFQTYAAYSSDPNNYRLWKLGAYAAALLPLIVGGMWNSSSIRRKKSWLVFRETISISLLISSVTCTLIWSTGWMGQRKPQVDLQSASNFEALAEQYDVIVAMPQMLVEYALYGNLHYGYPTRGYGLPAMRSNPARPLVIITEPNANCEIVCRPLLPEGLSGADLLLLATGPRFDTYLVGQDE